MSIEKLIEKSIEKEPLPNGFTKGPEYILKNNKKKGWKKRRK